MAKSDCERSSLYRQRRQSEGSKRMLVWMTPDVRIKIELIKKELGKPNISDTIRALIKRYELSE